MLKTGKRVAAAVATMVMAGVGITPAYAQNDELEWGPCPAGSVVEDGVECADFEVPVDYSNPDGDKITLTMSRIPAADQSARKGVIAGNPGGPGGDALGMFKGEGDGPSEGLVTLPEQVRAQYDQIAVEPRGLAFGTMLECTEGPREGLAALDITGGAIYDACEKNQPGYAQHITTDNTARDLEEARKVLGEEKLNLYGVSYGAALMPTYATMFPERTDHAIFDSPGSPDDRWFGLGATRKPIRAEALNSFFAWAAERDDEYHLGTTPLQVYKTWSDRVREESGLTATIYPPSAQEEDVPGAAGSLGQAGVDLLNAAVFTAWRAGTFGDAMGVLLGMPQQASQTGMAVMQQALYSEKVWPDVAEMIRDGAPEEEGTGEISEEEVENQMNMMVSMGNVERAIICNENMNQPRADLIAPTWITMLTGGDTYQFNEDFIASGQFCAGWPLPTPATQFNGDALEKKPLILGYTNDSAVGGAGVHDLQADMGGEVVTLEGFSHGVMGNDTEKVADKVIEYMNS